MSIPISAWGSLTLTPTAHPTQQLLIDILAGRHLIATDKTLPDELLVMILSHLLLEDQQPVQPRISSTNPNILPDPFTHLCSRVLLGCVLSPRLRGIMRATYFKVNTIRIAAPAESSPQQLLRSPGFNQSWSSDIQSLELSLSLHAELDGARWYTESFMSMCRANRFYLAEKDVKRLGCILRSLKEVLPRLRRLTLMLRVSPWSAVEGNGWTQDGEVCCLLLRGESGFVEVWREEIAPVLRKGWI